MITAEMGKFVDAVVDLAAGDYPPVIPVWRLGVGAASQLISVGSG